MGEGGGGGNTWLECKHVWFNLLGFLQLCVLEGVGMLMMMDMCVCSFFVCFFSYLIRLKIMREKRN